MANTTGKKFGGRKKGTPNKTTKEIKEAFELIVDNNLNNIDEWIKNIADDNPEKAINIILKFAEYVLPKLNKTEYIETKDDEYVNMTDDELEKEMKEMYKELHKEYGNDK